MQFDFGKNWLEFSRKALAPENIQKARTDFNTLFGPLELTGKDFLDIGFGQGLSALIACEKGARVIAIDINEGCRQALETSRKFFPLPSRLPHLVIGSILDPKSAELLHTLTRNKGYDVVHSWGVLHHTGKLWQAMETACHLVKPGGYFVGALYNRHWSSRIWGWLKWSYCKSPHWMKRVLIAGFIPPIWLAKFLVTGKNPNEMSRGMDFFYNVVDWVGGYPYEYAGREEVCEWMRQKSFECIKIIPPVVPTGCNEFVFRRLS